MNTNQELNINNIKLLTGEEIQNASFEELAIYLQFLYNLEYAVKVISSEGGVTDVTSNSNSSE